MGSLTPMYGLGSYGRIRGSIVISSPRTRLGSQGRIYAYYAARGKGQEYLAYLRQALGPIPPYNPFSVI